MKKREFLKLTAAASITAMLPGSIWALAKKKGRLRTAHIGVGGMMGGSDLASISSHKLVDVVALCDVDSKFLGEALKLHLKAKTYADYRVMLKEMKKDIDERKIPLKQILKDEAIKAFNLWSQTENKTKY